MVEQKKNPPQQVESAIEVSREMQFNRVRLQSDDEAFLRTKKTKKPRKSPWCVFYDCFMCKKCSEKKTFKSGQDTLERRREGDEFIN